MASIKNLQDEIVEEFSFLTDWEDKYSHIIDNGRSLPAFPAAQKTEENKIKGCQSQVWLSSEYVGGDVIYTADSDAAIVKGLAGLLVRTLSGHSPDEILQTELNFLDRIGMKQHLSPTRSNGLASLVKQMKMRALAYKAKSTQAEKI